MTSEYKALLQQKAALEEKINALLKEAKSDAIAKAQSLIQQYGLVQSDLFPDPGRKHGKLSVGEPRFRNPETGATWTGRGKPPKWIKDKDRTAFSL